MKYQLLTNWKYRLVETYTQKTDIKGMAFGTHYAALSPTGVLTILDDYAWDGASGPAFDTPTIMRGSLVHDCLYQLMRDGFLPRPYKDVADNLLYQICIEDGMWKARASWVLWAVKSFAKRSIEPEIKPEHPIVEV